MNLHEIYLASQLACENGGGNVDLSNYYTKSQTDDLISEKVDKVSGKSLSTNDFTDTNKSKLDGLENYDDVEIKAKIANIEEQTILNQSTLDYQRKNLFKNRAKSITTGGVTFTVTDNGDISATGTTTGTKMSYYLFNSNESSPDKNAPNNLVFDKDVIVSCKGEMVNAKLTLYIRKNGAMTYASINNASETYLLSANTEVQYIYIEQHTKDVSVALQNFGVMIRLADVTDDTYEPYKPSVAEYIASLEERIAALEGRT